MTILCTKICWYWTRIIEVFWQCNRSPGLFKTHCILIYSNLKN